MIRSDRTAATSDELLFEPCKALDAIRFHIREVRHVRDFVGSEQMLQRLTAARKVLRVPAYKWQKWKNIRRLVWLLSKSGIAYRVNPQNVAIFEQWDHR